MLDNPPTYSVKISARGKSILFSKGSIGCVAIESDDFATLRIEVSFTHNLAQTQVKPDKICDNALASEDNCIYQIDNLKVTVNLKDRTWLIEKDTTNLPDVSLCKRLS